MATSFQRDLDLLTKDLLAMGAKVEANIQRSVTALVERRSDLVEGVLVEDRVIDAMEVRIDEHCHHILALHQPVANDLRFLLTCTKVNNELERMGDHAKNVAKAANVLSRHEPFGIYPDLSQMSEACLRLVAGSLDALVQRDVELAQQVWDDDEAVDQAYDRTLEHLTAAMQTDPEIVPWALRAVGAARDLERIGDIATNVAKDVIFLVRGEIVAHRHLQR